MASRSDKRFADRYEADKKWYEQFISNRRQNFRNKPPTELQLYTIQQIENRSCASPKFNGTTIKDASAYIAKYGYSHHNRR